MRPTAGCVYGPSLGFMLSPSELLACVAAPSGRIWDVAVAAYPPYAEYQTRTTRQIPAFVAEPER